MAPSTASSTRRRCNNACGNCKRRKERCDGVKPCQRCRARGVKHECHFSAPVLRRVVLDSGAEAYEAPDRDTWNKDRLSLILGRSSDKAPATANAPNLKQHKPQITPLPRPWKRSEGGFIYFGGSSASSLLQNVRHLAKIAVGDCPFVSSSYNLSAGPPVDERLPSTIRGRLVAPSKPDIVRAKSLAKWYLYSTACFGALFDESFLIYELSAWLSHPDGKQDGVTSRLFLILALGAQTCPEENDIVAQEYYTYGRALTVLDTIGDSSAVLETAQCYTLITMYLINASRLNAAFIHLGQAVRAAHSLGLHRTDLGADFTPFERNARETLWKAIRVLDVYLSATLGRPLATCESRQTDMTTNYSPTVDMCMIYESLLTEVYAKSSTCDEILQQIIDRNRQWAARFPSGLQNDGVCASEQIESGDHFLPNVGLFHIKQAFYGVTILLTQSHLAGIVSASTQSPDHRRVYPGSQSSQMLGLACVQSAIDSIELFRSLLVADQAPKHLPLVTNSIFYAVLVLGMATFSDLYATLPIDEHLGTACKLLSVFDKHDWLSRQYLGISEDLSAACKTYTEKKLQNELNTRRALVSEIFGAVGSNQDVGLGQANLEPGMFEKKCPSVSIREEVGQNPSPAATLPDQVGTSMDLVIGSLTIDPLEFSDFLEDPFLIDTQDHFVLPISSLPTQ
ncbi:hypothetical protein PV08_05106 [Exophiala spinifera]|uniref:Zn(2)-C6 fungal-type domain-containing protein n=1 Tax=Exophiala spinifera TaxID=91928 RepID=A0A0D1YRP3_9EURO|nr:uncharacterized protein PV08_05106 [Exophiala spinifera]KIW17911.1 hypothetical protein PV08_05106 [Exophiala spinifera]